MDEFKEKGINIQEETIEKLREQYTSMLKEHRTYLNQQLSKMLYEEPIGTSEYNIESLIDKHLLTEVKYNGIFTINKLHEELEETFNNITKELQNENPDKEKIFTSYVSSLKEPIKNNQMDWIDTIIDDFKEKFIKELQDNHKSSQTNIDTNFSETIKNINKKLNIIMQEYKNKFLQDYNSIQKDFVTNNVTQISKLINLVDIDKIKLSKYERFLPLINLSNHELLEEKGIFFVQDKDTKEKFELSLDRDILSSKGNKLRFIIDDKKKSQGFLNNKTKRGIVIQLDPERINLTSLENNEAITISKSEGKYIFKRNLQSVTNIKEIKSILREIRDNYPGVFNKLIHDKDLAPIVRAIDKYNKKLVELKQKSTTQTTTTQNFNSEESTEAPQPKKKQ